MRTYLASLLLALSLAGTAAAEPETAPTSSTTTVTAPAAAPAPNAKKWQELTGSPLSLGQMTAAEQMGDEIGKAALSPRTKLAAKQGLAELETQVDIKLAPVVEVLDRAFAAKKRNEREQADVVRRMDELEARRPGPNATEGDVVQFNAAVDQINGELVAVHDKIKSDNDKYEKEFTTVSGDFDKWLSTRAGEYLDVGQKILSGEITDGLAWRQLLKAATGFEPAADVMDGRSSHTDSNTVVTGDVQKWTPEQRKAEQEKPGVQPPKRRKTQAPPPPGFDGPPPASSSDTAKSPRSGNTAKPKRSR